MNAISEHTASTCTHGRQVVLRGWSLLAALLSGSVLSAQPVDLPFDVAAAAVEVAPLERSYDGTVEAVNRATVSAQTAGRVAEVFYDIDDYVEAGSPIIRFTDVEQQAGLRRSEANLREAEARLKEAEDEFQRSSGLFEAGSGSKREYEQALAAREAASARVTAARSAVDEARQQVEYTLVRAPYSGILVERHVEVGESVTVGQPLISGLSLESLRVTVDLPQKAAAEVRERRQATVITEAGDVTPTRITIFPFADEATNTFTARLELPLGQFGLYPGMFVKVAFVIGESQRLLIPEAALVRRSEVTGVYVVGDHDAVRFRQVRIGNRFGDRVEILSGLDRGDRVAMDPVQAGIWVKSSAAHGNDE